MYMAKRLAMVAFVLVVVGGMAVAASEKKPSLDGKTFTVLLMKADAESGDPDTLTFANGMFDSSACHELGFGKSAYSVKPEGTKVAFEVHATAETKDKQVWNGTVDGNKVHGTMKMTDSKGVVTMFHFKGESVKAKS